MVRRSTLSRKARFRAALVLRRTTARAWAYERGITPGHLYQVLGGVRESKKLTDAIDAFVELTEQAA